MANITEFKLNPLDGSTTTEYSDGVVKSGSVVPATDLTAADVERLLALASAAAGYSVQPDVVRITSSAPIKCGAGRLAELRCESGSAISVSVYDNAAAGSGRVIYSGTLSAGGFAAPNAAWALNGMYASISGGVVEFVVSEA